MRQAFDVLQRLLPEPEPEEPEEDVGPPDEEEEEFDVEVSLGSTGGMGETLRWGRPGRAESGPLRSASAVTLRQVQDALCALCEEPPGPGAAPLWRHEDGRHCVAGGSTDPFHLAALVWAQLLGKEEAQVTAAGRILYQRALH